MNVTARLTFLHLRQGDVIDSRGRIIETFVEVPSVLKELYAIGYKLAIASRSEKPDRAAEVIELLGFSDLFINQQIYPGQKTMHFAEIKNETSVNYSNMLFFDDHLTNIRAVEAVGKDEKSRVQCPTDTLICLFNCVLLILCTGVISELVSGGVTRAVVKRGLQRFAKERNVSSN